MRLDGVVILRTEHPTKTKITCLQTEIHPSTDQGIDKLWHDGSKWKEFQFAQLQFYTARADTCSIISFDLVCKIIYDKQILSSI